jgi:hypothetical protein
VARGESVEWRRSETEKAALKRQRAEAMSTCGFDAIFGRRKNTCTAGKGRCRFVRA